MYNNHLLLHLSLIDGIGPAVIQTVLNNQRSDAHSSDLYSFSIADLMHHGLSQGAAEKVFAGLSDHKLLETELSLIQKHNIHVLTIHDIHYPALLKAIYMPPAVLYVRGVNYFDDTKKHVAIVGARAANTYGTKMTSAIVQELVAANITTVSGGALGIDTTVHETTVKNGGKTIVVLGSGLLNEYPASNKKLFASVVESGGTIVSSFPLRRQPLPGNFPARNRIIAGLSHGSLVVQAAQKSGALITAHYALEQGRDVFALPGDVNDPLSAGCHSLIQQGAKLITCGKDIIEELGCHYTATPRDIQQTVFCAQQLPQSSQSSLSAIQKQIITACKHPQSIDDMMQKTEIDLATLQSELFTLQLEGLVEQDFTGMWVEKNQ